MESEGTAQTRGKQGKAGRPPVYHGSWEAVQNIVVKYVEKRLVKYTGRIADFFPDLGPKDIVLLDEWRGMFEELGKLQSDWRFPWALHLKIARKLNKTFKLCRYRRSDRFHKSNALCLQKMCCFWLEAQQQKRPWATDLDSPTPQPPAPLVCIATAVGSGSMVERSTATT